VKRLKPGNPLTNLGHTHVCVAPIPEDEFGGSVCNHPLTLHKRHKGAGHSWITTRAIERFARFHKTTDVSMQHFDRAVASHEDKVKQQLIYGKETKHTESESSKAVNVSNKTSSSVFSKLDRFVKLTPSQRQLSSQAQWYVYSDQKVSKRTFEDPYFKKMLQVNGLVAMGDVDI